MHDAWAQLMWDYKNVSDVLIASAQCETTSRGTQGSGKSLCQHFGIPYYPRIIYGQASEPQAYGGVRGRDYQSLRAFAEEHLGGNPLPPVGTDCEDKCARAGSTCIGKKSAWGTPSCAMGCLIANRMDSAGECKSKCNKVSTKKTNECYWLLRGQAGFDNCNDCPNDYRPTDGECSDGCDYHFNAVVGGPVALEVEQPTCPVESEVAV